MAKYILRLSSKETNSQNQILIQFKWNRNDVLSAKSRVFVNKAYWNPIEQNVIIPDGRGRQTEEQRQLKEQLETCKETLSKIQSFVFDAFKQAGAGERELPKDWLQAKVDEWHTELNKGAKKTFLNSDLGEEMKKVRREKETFFEALDNFIETHEMTEGRREHYEGLRGMLHRFEAYNHYHFTFDALSVSVLRQFSEYLKNEYNLFLRGKLNDVLEEFPARMTEARGKARITMIMKCFRTFIRWANGLNKSDRPEKPYTNNNPFNDFPIADSSFEGDYTTPYFITTEERKTLEGLSLPNYLAAQRDIFIFHCCTGPRYSDLHAMTRDNIINGCVEYIPQKTIKNQKKTVRVPLNNTAKEILEKYHDTESNRLLPFISEQKYNKYLKEIFALAGLTRLVTIIDSKTGKEVKKPLNELVSSHLARRTFIGNLYNKVKDPDLIADLTGHSKGSRAFRRYRAINDEAKKELVSMLD